MGLGQPITAAADARGTSQHSLVPEAGRAASPALTMPVGLIAAAPDSAAIEDYWTEDRMRGAQPYPLQAPPALPDARAPQPRPRDPGDPGWAPSRAPDGVDLPIITGNPPVTIPLAYTPTAAYTTAFGNLADAAWFPHSAVGKVYFTMSGMDFTCSGAVIGEHAVWTAAHCVSDGSGVFHSNWMFVPGFAYLASPYAGPWTAAYAIVPARFHYGLDLGADYGVVIVNRAAGRAIRQMTGALGFAWNLPNKQLVRALGYPIPYYGGQRLVESEGYSLLNDPAYTPPPVGIYSKLKSGASGGPWLLNFRAGAAGEANFLNGDTSFQRTGTPQIYSPAMDGQAKRLWDCAQASTPENLDCPAATPMLGLDLVDAGSSALAAPGELITHQLAIENRGDVPATGVSVVDELPTTVSFVGGSLSGESCHPSQVGVLRITCPLASLAPGASATATLVFMAPAAPFEGVVTGGAFIAQANPGAAMDQWVSSQHRAVAFIHTGIREVNLRLDLQSAPVVLPGAPFTHTLAVHNLGPRTAHHVTVVDALPPAAAVGRAALPGGDCGGAGGIVTCTLAALEPGGRVTATVALTAPAQAGVLASLGGAAADETAEWRHDSLDILVQEADLALSQSAADAAQVGALLRYTLTIENRGPLTAANVALSDTLPAGAALVSATLAGGACAEAGGVVACSLAGLPDGGVVAARLVVTAPAQPGDAVNLAYVTADQADARPENSRQVSITTRIEACWARVNDAATAYYPVQAAVDAAQPGDVVKVAGACSGATARLAPAGYPYAASISQTVFISKDLTLRGGYTLTDWVRADPAGHPTTLDALGQGRALFVAGASLSVTVEGLLLTGGAADGPGGGGGYILASEAALRDNIFDGNAAGSGNGGGLRAQPGGRITLSGNTFTGNTALLGGGGMHLFQGAHAWFNGNVFSGNAISNGVGEGLALYRSLDASLSENRFDANRLDAAGDAGGGLYLGRSGGAEVVRNIFAGNTGPGGGLALADSDGGILSRNTFTGNAGGSGGGLSVYASRRVTVSDNVFRHNTAGRSGGGLYIGPLADYLPGRPADVTLRNNVLISNTADAGAGGAAVSASDGVTLINTIIADNAAGAGSAGGVVIQSSSVRLAHATLAGNAGERGILVATNSNVSLTNTILVSHAVGLQIDDGCTATLDSVLWHGAPVTVSAGADSAWAVRNEYTGAPAFLDPAGGDYHIGAGSAVIGRGIDDGVTTDIDGDPRHAAPDLGADEYTPHRRWLPLIVR
jgi:uncharacterized repeat protein (TIGR01451 family)